MRKRKFKFPNIATHCCLWKICRIRQFWYVLRVRMLRWCKHCQLITSVDNFADIKTCISLTCDSYTTYLLLNMFNMLKMISNIWFSVNFLNTIYVSPTGKGASMLDFANVEASNRGRFFFFFFFFLGTFKAEVQWSLFKHRCFKSEQVRVEASFSFFY